MLENLLTSSGHRLRHKDADEYIAYMGDELTDMVMLVEGTIYSSMTNQEGKEIVVEVPWFMGENPIFVFLCFETEEE